MKSRRERILEKKERKEMKRDFRRAERIIEAWKKRKKGRK
jgi:hypothetical protein